MAHREKIEVFLKDFLVSLQMGRLYGAGHQIFKSSLDTPFASLQQVLEDTDSLTLGVIHGELAFEDEVISDPGRLSLTPVAYFTEKGVEKVSFLRGIEKAELEVLVRFLVLTKKEVKAEARGYLAQAGVRNILIAKIKPSSQPGETRAQQVATVLQTYEQSYQKISQSLTDIIDDQALDHLGLKLAMQNMMDGLLSQSAEFLRVSTMRRYDLGTSAHLLNVAILSMYLASKLGFSKEEVMELGTAALFHDIGKLYISRKIIRKPERLTADEFDRIKSHALLGAELLMEYVPDMGILPVVVAFEHHLKYDQSGYPRVPFAQKPHPASLIVSVCDVYDALFQKRSYKADYAPDLIYNIMIKEKGTTFDPWFLERFYQIVGVWPIGSLVNLSDGRVALVKEENEEEILLPKVEVVYPQEKKEFIDLKEHKGQLAIYRYINPWKEGKEILDAVGITLGK